MAYWLAHNSSRARNRNDFVYFAIELSFLLIIFKLLPEFKLSFLRDKMIFTVKPIQPEKLENLQ